MPALSPTMLRIARRVAQVALEPSDANGLREAIIRLEQAEADADRKYGRNVNPAAYNFRVGLAYGPIYSAMARLVMNVARTRVIPKESRTLFAQARRETDRVRDFDKKEWYEGKGHKFATMLLQSDDWPLLSEQDGSVVLVDGFQVSDSTGLGIEAAVNVVAKATRLIKSSDVPRLTRCLYGPVRIVGSISGNAKLTAWYFYKEDDIEILHKKRYDDSLIKSIIHEVGHRYYDKFLPGDVKTRWRHHHDAVGLSQFDVPLDKPVPGLQVDVYKDKPVVERIDQPFIYFVGDPGRYKYSDVVKHMRESRAVKVYPTPYASKNQEEHFCEALALYVLGDLEEPHLSAFRRIVVEGE